MSSFAPRVVSALAATLLLAAQAQAQAAKARPLTIEVDLTEAPRKLLKSRLVIPARPGPLKLYYPKWIPGEHGPTGPITDLAGLKITAAGKAIPWRRDEVDMYALHCTVPEGADAVEVALNFLTPATTTGFSSGACCTHSLAVLNWNQVVLYPAGRPARAIECQASLRLPAGWKLGTALPVRKTEGEMTSFGTVSLEELLDAPVLCGAHLRDIPIGPAGGVPHSIAIACDSAAALEVSPALKANLDRLVEEAYKLFGARHYRAYKFLLTLSDQVAHFGLEHHECSDNRVPERLLVDGRMTKGLWATLLPHEYVHSWNGKYRRPADMITDDFQKPQRTRLLWVYEGLTQYLGVVLAARSGLWTPEQFRDNLAQIAEWAQNQRGRTWRPLEDTAVAAQLLYAARADWASWRRSVDFYDEGILLWLDIDTLIRQKSDGKLSLDDFCRRFHGGEGGAPRVKGFTLDELAADLNAVVPHDWKRLLIERVTATSAAAPLDGLKRGGWKLAYGAKRSGLHETREGDDKVIDLTASVGLLLKEDGTVGDVIPGKAAHRAGVGPGMKLIAVNGRRWSAPVLRAALAATKAGGKLELLVENGEFFRTFALEHREGERYPRLEREAAAPDVLAAIVRPLAPPAKAGAAAN
jgi:predicted metalloprotease with PDZ domain